MRNRFHNLRLLAAATAFALTATACTSGSESSATQSAGVNAGGGSNHPGNITYDQMREYASKSLTGKTLAFVPNGLGQPLTVEWARRLKEGAEMYGLNFKIRDPNWDATRQVKDVQQFVSELTAGSVLVVHNFNVQLLATTLQKAEEKGIYVLQIGQESNYKTDGIVEADSIAEGEMAGADIVKACGQGTNTSHKVSLIQGDPTSAFNLGMVRGIMNEFKKDGTIKVVSNQPATVWDRTKAHDITATVVQANPDLCAYWGGWDVMDVGGAQAIKEAGLQGKVKVFTSDSSIACQQILDGMFTQTISYSGAKQADVVIDLANYLLQSGLKPGAVRMIHFMPLTRIDKSNAAQQGLCYDGKGHYGQ